MKAIDEQDAALFARASTRIGTVLRGKYRLDRVLGVGGMASVYAATHRNQAEFAVKLLHPELSIRGDIQKRFLREGYVANSVKHPGAVLVVDDDVAEDGSAFLVMELLKGMTVDELWQRSSGTLPSAVVTQITLQLLDVLTAAHTKAIVHRDLKPANLFLTNEGAVKVLDFGIARIRDAFGNGDQHSTAAGTMLGTPAFVAPEQALAKAEEIDAQTDIFAVGATMFTLLSGRLVHEGANSSQLIVHAATKQARPLATVTSLIPLEIGAIVDRALAFDKVNRWKSAAEMAAALRRASDAVLFAAPSRSSLARMVHESRPVEGGTTARLEHGSHPSGEGPRVVVRSDAESGGHAVTEMSQPPPPFPQRGASPQRFPGLTTNKPVSRDPAREKRRRALAPLWIGGVMLLSVSAAIGGKSLWRGQLSRAPAAAAGPAPPPTATATATMAAASSASSIAPGGSASVALDDVTQDAGAVSAASAAPNVPARGAKTGTAKPPVPPQIPATATASDCNPPYTLDSDGDKHWKRACIKK